MSDNQFSMDSADAIKILEDILQGSVATTGRGNGKTFAKYRAEIAILMGIQALKKVNITFPEQPVKYELNIANAYLKPTNWTPAPDYFHDIYMGSPNLPYSAQLEITKLGELINKRIGGDKNE